MKNRENLKHLLLALGLALGVASIPVGAAYAQDAEAGVDSVELGNTADTPDQNPAAADAGVAGADATADAAQAQPPKDPREAYKDLVLKQAADDAGPTSAVSRRYKKVDKAAYNELIQSGALQPAQ